MKHPPPPDVEFTAALAVADAAMRPVLCDRTVWAEEAARTDAEMLTWPPKIVMADAQENHAGLLRALVYSGVERVLLAMCEAEAGAKLPDDPRERANFQQIVDDLDPAAPEVQIVFRVVNRAMLAADAVLRSEFSGRRGGGHRLSGKQKFFNWSKAREVDIAVQSGVPRAEALEALGFSRAAAYRAMKRKRS